MRALNLFMVYFLCAAIQFFWSTYLAVFGLAPQIILVLTVAIAARAGPVVGQCYGFAWGLFLDVLQVHVFGANALALTLVGYGVGLLRKQLDVSSFFPQLILVVALTPIYFLFIGLVGLVFEHHFLWAGWGPFLGGPLYNAFLTPFAFEFIRRFVKAGEGGVSLAPSFR